VGAAEEIVEVFEHFPSFCKLLDIKLVKTGQMVRFDPSRWNAEQRAFNRGRSGRDIVLKPRQVGISTLELARDLQYALVNPGANVLVVVHHPKLKDELFVNLRVMADGLGRLGLLPRTRYSTKTEYVFAETNSSIRIVEAGTTQRAAQGKGRSGTVHRLHATEMAFWLAAGETWPAIKASVSDAAEVVIESTANGAGGLYYDLVQQSIGASGDYKFHFFPWYEQLRYRTIPPAGFDPRPIDKWEVKLRKAGCNDQQIAWWRSVVRETSIDKALQEYPIDSNSCFRAAGRSFFDQDVIDDMFERLQEPVGVLPLEFVRPATNEKIQLGSFHMFEPTQRDLQYVIGADVAEGVGRDASAASVRERRSGRKVAAYCSNSIEPGDFGLALATLGRIYNEALVGPERNNHGHATLRAMVKEAKYRQDRIYHTENGKLGWSTDGATRPVMIDDLATALRSKATSVPDRETLAECRTLVKNERGKVEARDKGLADGCKDDRWIADCIAWQLRNAPLYEYRGVDL
jgi:hypothetical protein